MRLFCSLSILFLLLISGCKDDDCDDLTNPDCPNYDACTALQELTGDFVMFDVYNFREGAESKRILTPVIGDTTYPNLVEFSGLDEAVDTFIWDTDDPNFTVDTRSWGATLRPDFGIINVGLATQRMNSDCPNREFETAATNKTWTVIPYHFQYPAPYIRDAYIGNNESEPDSSEFVIRFVVTDESVSSVALRNFPRNAPNSPDNLRSSIGLTVNWKSFTLNPNPQSACCHKAYGAGTFNNDRSELTIRYSYISPVSGERIEDVWKGRRHQE